jgi:ATP adenylyltransferase
MNHLWSPWRKKYIEQGERKNECVFCREAQREDGIDNLIVYRGAHTFAILNLYPYTNGHLMIVPYDHRSSLDLLTSSERAEMMELVSSAMVVLQHVYHPEGFNVGANIGSAAGAGIVGHVHIHVVPRWVGDTNFMSTLGETRILPETLEDTYHRVREAWLTI